MAEEWVDAEVSSRLARLIVERRRADLCPPEPQLKQSTIVTSRGQSTLCLPFSCEPADASTEAKPVQLSAKPPCKRARNERPASTRSNEKTTGTHKKMRRTREAPRPQIGEAPRMANNLFPTVPANQRTVAQYIAKSVQAATSLRALDVIACGPPEAHPSLRKVTATSPFYFRLGCSAEASKFQHPPVTMNQHAAARWKLQRPLHASRAGKIFSGMIEPGRSALCVS